jgi:hypothetical protein
MGIISEFTAFLRGRGAPKPTEQIPVPKETACLIFLDYRNLQPQWREHVYSGIRWDLIRKEIAQISRGSKILHQAIYRSPEGSDSSKDKDVQEVWVKHGYMFEGHTKDIDSWISSDLWQKCLEATDNPEIGDLRIVLGSGDVDFLRPLKRIKERLGATRKITIVVVSWKYKVSRDLLEFADEFRFLDDIPNLVRHTNRKPSVAGT